jgi:ubiquinone/menaquinone biosynthesis C-methylase UbiE
LTVAEAEDFDFTAPAFVDAYDELPLWSALAGQLLLRHLPLSPRTAALDIGCGTGFPAIELAERLGPASTVHGLDPWAAALDRARRKALSRRVANVTFIEGDGAAIPFPDRSFDLIVSNLGVNNFADAAGALAECRRVARPSGRLALTTNLQGHMAEFYAIFRRALGSAEAERALDDHIDRRATVARLHAQLIAAGFEIVRTVDETASMRFADGTALLHHSFIRLGFLPGWRDVVAPADHPAVFDRLVVAIDAHVATAGSLDLSIPLAYVEARA